MRNAPALGGRQLVGLRSVEDVKQVLWSAGNDGDNEKRATSVLISILKEVLNSNGKISKPQGLTPELFVDCVWGLWPETAWQIVFTQVGQELPNLLRTDAALRQAPALWRYLLRVWQRTTEPPDRLNKSSACFPLEFLPSGADLGQDGYRILRSFGDFVFHHDAQSGTSIVPQILENAEPPTTMLLEFSQSMFYNYGQKLLLRHGLDLRGFVLRRLRRSGLFLVLLASFLRTKLADLTEIFTAAKEGREPPIESLILDSRQAIDYFVALLDFHDEAVNVTPTDPTSATALIREQRMECHLESLRMSLVDIYTQDSQSCGITTRTFISPSSPAEEKNGGSETATSASKSVDEVTTESSRPLPDATPEDMYFAAFYSGEVSAEELVNLMANLVSYPPATPEAELLARMLRTLFTECRHFPKYPPKELHRTGEFFGKLVRSELLLKRPELQLLAIRCVMEALRKDPTSNIFKFGLVALQGFIDKAHSSPAFLVALTKMQGIEAYFPQLTRYAHACLALMPPNYRRTPIIDVKALAAAIAPMQMPPTEGLLSNLPPSFMLLPSSPPAPASHNFSPGQLESLLMRCPEISAQIVEPPEAFKDQVSKCFNSLARGNVQAKAIDLLSSMRNCPDHFPWLAFYIVKTRVSKEPNHHQLYAEFCDHLGHPKMIEMLTNVTYDCINALLRFADTAREAAGYRAALKSLGSWLGLITLARNRSLKSRCMDLKLLLYDAYERGNLTVVVPLVCALLEKVSLSRIFKLPNPWTLSCLCCLGQLYVVPKLRQTIRYEIELLAGHLGVDLEEFLPVATRQSPNEASSPQQYNRSNNFFLALQAPPESASGDFAPGAATVMFSMPPPGEEKPQLHTVESAPDDQNHPGSVLSAVVAEVVVSRGLAVVQEHSNLKMVIPIAIERAIRELISVISERTVVLAVGTTLEIVLKDFCVEGDVQLLSRAASMMAASLASSIVLVTGRAPLRAAMIQEIKEAITASEVDDVIEHTAHVLANDNLMLASGIVEQVVVDYAVREVAKSLRDAVTKRRAAADTNQPFVDTDLVHPGGTWPQKLPPSLLPAPEQSRALLVYRDFPSLLSQTTNAHPLDRTDEHPKV